MKTKLTHSALIALLALGGGFVSSAALAQPGYQDPGYGRYHHYRGRRTVPYDRYGHYSCGFNERHTHLERQSCGGTHYRY